MLLAAGLSLVKTAITLYLIQAQAPEFDISITAPVGGGLRPYQDGIMIAGRERRYGYTIQILFTNTGNTTIEDVEIIGDAVGTVEVGPEGYTLIPKTENKPSIVAPDGTRDPEGTVAQWITQDNVSAPYFKINKVKPGETWKCTYSVDVPESVPQDVGLRLTIRVSIGEVEYTLDKKVRIVPPPVQRLWIVIGLAAAAFLGLIVLGRFGFFKLYSNIDLVTMALIGAAQVVWVQILGRQLVFPVLNRVPLTYNFAVGDFPYIFLLITAAMLVRKPGTVSLTLFVYDLVSEIGWYGLNPLWWAYPFAEGLPADFYMLLRGRAIFTNKLSFLKLKIPAAKLEAMKSLPGLKFFDGFMIGFLRGFFMQYSLYTVFFPNLFRIYYDWGYVFWWMTIPWAIGNAIEGAISVPLAEKIEEAVRY